MRAEFVLGRKQPAPSIKSFRGLTGGETPVPIPNTAVKTTRGDGTAAAGPWESSTLRRLLVEGAALRLRISKISLGVACRVQEAPVRLQLRFPWGYPPGRLRFLQTKIGLPPARPYPTRRRAGPRPARAAYAAHACGRARLANRIDNSAGCPALHALHRCARLTPHAYKPIESL